MTIYRHTQFGGVVFVSIVAAALVGLGIGVWVAEARPVVAIAGLLILVAVLFSSLTIRIGDGWLDCWFGLGVIRRRIRIADLRDVQVVRNRWWYGWGIRLTPHGWLWNVSGLDAIELIFASGKKFRLGTDDPEGLLIALRTSLASR